MSLIHGVQTYMTYIYDVHFHVHINFLSWLGN